VTASSTSLRRTDDHWVGGFTAMACPCEVLVDDCTEAEAAAIVQLASQEAWRVERKFSRYRHDSVVHEINASDGRGIDVDEETARLLDFGAQLTRASEGAFDLTSGVLRKAWTFDGGNAVPAPETVTALLAHVGWHRVRWERPRLTLEPGMQIDFGGIGKEYAVDRALQLVAQSHPGVGVVVNFGGDLAIGGHRRADRAWRVGIESASAAGRAARTVALDAGALATSGDSRRFVVKDGTRYSHILDARTGWPVKDAPRSVTVHAGTCTEAGTWSTLASLKGAQARQLLEGSGKTFWLQ